MREDRANPKSKYASTLAEPASLQIPYSWLPVLRRTLLHRPPTSSHTLCLRFRPEIHALILEYQSFEVLVAREVSNLNVSKHASPDGLYTKAINERRPGDTAVFKGLLRLLYRVTSMF